MKEKTQKQIENMKSQTFGVEIEMTNINRIHAAKIAQDYFNAKYGINRTIRETHDAYDTVVAYDNQNREWKFQRDSSISSVGEGVAEMATPICYYSDMEDLQELVRLFRHAGAKSNSSYGCGVHIHIGADGHTPQTLRNLANIMASHEDLIIEALELSQSRVNQWCRVVDPRFLKEINDKKPQTMSDFYDVWYESQGFSYNRMAHYNQSRYHMLNFHATHTKGTIEFRCFEFCKPNSHRRGGLHAGRIKAYVQFCMALSQAAKDQRCATPKKITVGDNKKYAMRAWLMRIGFIGEDFETARKVFTDRLDGWANGERHDVAC